jgi:hypothetical protein
VFADVKTVKPPYLDQEQHLQYLDAYEISNVAFVLASKKINLAHVSTTNSFHKDKNNGRLPRHGFLVRTVPNSPLKVLEPEELATIFSFAKLNALHY